MPKNELLDALFDLFRQYEYWTLKGLREKVNQPETYLKETLESIATLIKTGTFALKWTLKPEYKEKGIETVKQQLKQEGIDEDGPGDDGDDDDEEEMEDVQI